MEALDHRRATAQRNRQAIIDAAARILVRGEPLNMMALAAEAGVSRQTLYSHFKTLGEAVEVLLAQAVETSVEAVAAAKPSEGTPLEALERMLDASWERLARFQAIARAAGEHVAPAQMHRAHRPLIAVVAELVERGQAEGAFRTDLPADWLTHSYYSLIHSADEYARSHRVARAQALAMLKQTLVDLFTPR